MSVTIGVTSRDFQKPDRDVSIGTNVRTYWKHLNKKRKNEGDTPAIAATSVSTNTRQNLIRSTRGLRGALKRTLPPQRKCDTATHRRSQIYETWGQEWVGTHGVKSIGTEYILSGPSATACQPLTGQYITVAGGQQEGTRTRVITLQQTVTVSACFRTLFFFLEPVPLRARPRERVTTQTLKHTSTQGEKQGEAADSENNAENVVTTSSRSVTEIKYYNL